MNYDILESLIINYPEESAIDLINFCRKYPDLTFENYIGIYTHAKENVEYDRKKLQEHCDQLNCEGVYFKFVGEKRIVFSKFSNFFISDENFDLLKYSIEDLRIEKELILFHESKESPYDGFTLEKFNSDKYSRITQGEYERVKKQNLTSLEHNYECYKK